MPINKVPGLKKVTELFDSDIVKVDSGDTLRVGDIEQPLPPGHTPGSRVFVKNTLAAVIRFINGCGRVDYPAEPEDKPRVLCTLPDDTLLLPGRNYGHVPNATMGDSKRMSIYHPTWTPENHGAANASTVRRGKL